MSSHVAERFVDAVLRDGWLTNPSELLEALRTPSGRGPAASSRAVSGALSGLDDGEALPIVAAVLDSAYFSVFTLLDSGLKNSGIRVEIACDEDRWGSEGCSALLHEAYRVRVDPNGLVRTPS